MALYQAFFLAFSPNFKLEDFFISAFKSSSDLLVDSADTLISDDVADNNRESLMIYFNVDVIARARKWQEK